MLGQIRGAILRRALPKSLYLTLSRSLYDTHYDVLNLSRTANSKEIRDAFIKLSKEHHPDLSKSSLSHKKFLRINEAYEILSKPESKRSYDLGLIAADPAARTFHTEYESTGYDPRQDSTFWANRDKSEDEIRRIRPYYGLKGVKRLPNYVIVWCCILVTFIGVSLQVIAITNSFTFQRDELVKKSIEAEKTLSITRKLAEDNGNHLQIELLKMKLMKNNKND